MQTMKKHFQLLSLFCVGLILSACQPVPKDDSKLTGGGENQVQQTEKIASMEESLESVARIESVVSSLATGRASINDNLVADMKKMLEDAKCYINYKKLDSVENNREAYLEISGVGCPILADYEISYKSSGGDSVNFLVKASFTIHDKALRLRNDIAQLEIAGSGRATLQDNKLVTHFKFSGQLTSITKGMISLQGSQDERKNALDPSYSANGKTRYLMTFPPVKKVVEEKEMTVPGYTVELMKATNVITGKDQSAYSVNGASLSKISYLNYIESLGILAFPN